MTDFDYTEVAARLRVLWNRGRHTYSTFFAELQTARAEIGDDVKFADWCFYDLKISVSVIQTVSGVLVKADRDRVRQEIAVVKKLAAAESKAQREADRAAKDARQHAKTEAEKKQRKSEGQQRRRQRERENAPKPILISDVPRLAELQERDRTLEVSHRVERGEVYAEMHRIVDAGEAGKDEFGRKWKWTRWVEKHLPHTRRWIEMCIAAFKRTTLRENFQQENVVSINEHR